ncbi:uncharacterized protein LOC126661190 [Mercurialis annua]|uniref:uncharacterized protein LOC126661190 n=1 Tax=Mercurialis annua TaxID=3986 RepID=UPI00215E3A46|nr:uncharacterized protein LOC126661190 [Mercurialis annua]
MLKGSRHQSIMHAVKGGWVGQTFALSKRNESGGRKARLRISKGERKEMIESFIKKHQSLNNGNFPSLNLTHKEVGGSFYTIREIVREIIQENRVLGPAKSSPEEQDLDKLYTQYSLGTVSSEPEASGSMLPNGSAFASSQHQDLTEEVYIMSKELQYGFGNRKIIDVSLSPLNNKESDQKISVEEGVVSRSESLEKNADMEEMIVSRIKPLETSKNMDEVVVDTSEPLETNKRIGEAIVSRNQPLETKRSDKEVTVSTSKVTQIADVIVEAFPLQPVTQPTCILDENSDEERDLNRSLVEKDVEKVLLEPVSDTSLSSGTDLLDNSFKVDDKAEKLADSSLQQESKLPDDKEVKHRTEFQIGNSNSFATKDAIAHDAHVGIDVEMKATHNDMKSSEAKVVNAANGALTKTIDRPHATKNSIAPITQQKVIQNKSDAQHSSNSRKGSTPTLERIKIESWEGTSKKSTKSESNPVVAAFKSFVASFVKFWSG